MFSLENTTYLITVKTGDIGGAGTDAHVYITLYGNDGHSGKHFFFSSVYLFFSKHKMEYQIHGSCFFSQINFQKLLCFQVKLC